MKTIFFYLTVIVVMLISACKPDGTMYYEETDIVLTDYDDEFNFANYQTYAMPDKVVRVTGNLVEGENPEFVKEPMNTDMINQIAQNMASLGWQRVEDPEQADVVLFPAAWKNTTIYYWYDYWCWWYPYYCGWGYYPQYYSSYTTGTLVMTLVVDGDEYVDADVVWTGAINGLLSGYYDADRMRKSVDQAFTQSPYLGIN